MRGEALRLTIDSTDDRDAAIAALGALFGVHLAVVADTGEAATASAPTAAAAAGAPGRHGARSNSGRTVSTANRGGRRQPAGKTAPSPSVRSARKTAARDAAVLPTAPNAQIRTWAKGQGMAVASRGRIPTSVVDAYQAANPA